MPANKAEAMLQGYHAGYSDGVNGGAANAVTFAKAIIEHAKDGEPCPFCKSREGHLYECVVPIAVATLDDAAVKHLEKL